MLKIDKRHKTKEEAQAAVNMTIQGLPPFIGYILEDKDQDGNVKRLVLLPILGTEAMTINESNIIIAGEVPNAK